MNQENKKKQRILIVDDHQFIHEIVSKFLEFNGFEIAHAFDGQQALEEVNKRRPDLIIMDQMMPVMDGITCTIRIREQYTNLEIPIIFLTAKADKDTLVAVLNAGADDYITKPFEKEELLARINAQLRLRILQNEVQQKARELDEANRKIKDLNDQLMVANKQLRKRVYDLHNLFELSVKFLSNLEYVEVVNTSLLTIIGLMAGVSRTGIAVKSEDKSVMKLIGLKGPSVHQELDLVIPVEDEFIRYVESMRTPVILKDESLKIYSPVRELLTEQNFDIVSPLIYQGELLGILLVGTFTSEVVTDESVREILGILSTLISVALINANLFDQVKSLSYKDGMTGLHNYRYFENRMKEEFSRSQRTGEPLSLIILDVDHFKNYNDKLGHLAGDEVLRKLARILQDSLRKNDIPVRYGGEEFAIILPGASKENAYKVANRIRKAVEKAPFPDEHVQPLGKLTVSVGLATFPEDADNLIDLIEKADTALYEAKHQGRNRVVSYLK